MRIVGGAGYGNDLRERIVEARRAGASTREVAERFQVCVNTVQEYLRREKAGTLTQRVRPSGRPRTMQSAHEAQLLAQVKAHPDATLEEHAAMLLEVSGFKTSYRTVDRVFRRHGITHKKNTGRQRTQ